MLGFLTAGPHVQDALLTLSRVGGIPTNVMPLIKFYVGNREDGRHDKEREGRREGRKEGKG